MSDLKFFSGYVCFQRPDQLSAQIDAYTGTFLSREEAIGKWSIHAFENHPGCSIKAVMAYDITDEVRTYVAKVSA